jgi:hypothetical protein
MLRDLVRKIKKLEFWHILQKTFAQNDNPQISWSWPGGAESRFNGQSLVKKWCVADPKIIFAKNQELVLLALKCKPASVLEKLAGACTKFKRYIRRFARQNKIWYVYPKWSIIYMGCCVQVSIFHFDSSLTKNPITGPQKWKMHFSWDETKIGLRGVPHQPKGHACVWYGHARLISRVFVPWVLSFVLEFNLLYKIHILVPLNIMIYYMDG